jgi:hypothetical protein
MTEPPAPERIAVIWSPEARADLRAIDRETAMQILHCVNRYLANHTGDVKRLKSPFTGFRLRCGSPGGVGNHGYLYDTRNGHNCGRGGQNAWKESGLPESTAGYRVYFDQRDENTIKVIAGEPGDWFLCSPRLTRIRSLPPWWKERVPSGCRPSIVTMAV